jgi:hypothetical protein
MAAEVAFEEGITQRRVSGETIRATLSRLLGVKWQRAKRWITSPDPLYERKKTPRPSDSPRRAPSRVGCGLLGRVLVEQQGGFADSQVAGARKGSPSVSSSGRFPKDVTLRAEGHILLRPLSARTRRGDVVEVRGWEACEFHNHAVPFVVLREARGGRQESGASHLGQSARAGTSPKR